jgi:ribonuclease Z
VRPLIHASLVNDRFGDPALYVETMFEKRAILFDLGDIGALSPRKIQRLEHVFVSHTHIDHFAGFDRLLRVLVGRDKKIELYGPPGFIDNVHHKLRAYCWNLADRYPCDLVFVATEINERFDMRTTTFRLNTAFTPEPVATGRAGDGVICSTSTFRVTAATLDHGTPCLAFAIEEPAHLNVWKNKLAELDLPVGPWLRELKTAIIENRPGDELIAVRSARSSQSRQVPLDRLRDVLSVTPGQKIAYVTDAADTATNRAAIIRLAKDADLLFIEAHFAEADRELSADRAHLTTAAAGAIARAAKAHRVEPFHFSPRYTDEEQRMLSEVIAAFSGGAAE